MSGNLGISGVGCSFPDFDKILDFTSAGGESSTSVNVNGDTDLEYKCFIRNLNTSNQIYCTLNTGGSYGQQYFRNDAGSIAAGRITGTYIATGAQNGWTPFTILTPSGFPKTGFYDFNLYSSGTTIAYKALAGSIWSTTSNVTSIVFTPATGTMTAGSRIIVYRRRQN